MFLQENHMTSLRSPKAISQEIYTIFKKHHVIVILHGDAL